MISRAGEQLPHDFATTLLLTGQGEAAPDRGQRLHRPHVSPVGGTDTTLMIVRPLITLARKILKPCNDGPFTE
jgi:hypothetical protein